MSKSAGKRGLVIFDCDGVLVDSNAIVNRVHAECLKEAGLPEEQVAAMVKSQGRLPDLMAAVEFRTKQLLPDGWLPELEARRHQALEQVRPIPGARSAVIGVRALGYEVCVASQGPLAKTELTLGRTGLREFFGPEKVFSAYSVPRGKPQPDLFLYAAASLGFSPDQCLVIEDSPGGVTAARLAGMAVLGYSGPGSSWSPSPAELSSAKSQGVGRRLGVVCGRGLIELFDSMAELPRLVSRRRAPEFDQTVVMADRVGARRRTGPRL